MNHHKVRFHAVWVSGIFTDAHHFEDYYVGTEEPLESFAERLAAKVFSMKRSVAGSCPAPSSQSNKTDPDSKGSAQYQPSC